MNLRVLIVDDEPPGVKALRDILEREPSVQVAGECLDGQQALRAIRELRPEVAFMDIHMPGLDAFEVLEELEEEEMPLVVFVTAYDHHALHAFAVHALDYILKPPSASALQAALARARTILEGKGQRDFSQRIYALLDHVEHRRPRCHRFAVREGERILFIKAEDVEAIEATGNYMHLYMGKRSYMIRETMAHLEQRLDPSQFVRTHRSWMANPQKIREVRPWSKGAYLLITEGGTEVPVSRSYREGMDKLVRGTLLE